MVKASVTLEIGTMLSFNSLINLIGKRFVFRECRILQLSRRLRKTNFPSLPENGTLATHVEKKLFKKPVSNETHITPSV